MLLKKRARKEQAREVKEARKQLQIESMAQQRRPRSRSSKQKLSSETAATMIEPIEEMIPARLRSRRGRAIRKTARFDEK
jgi:hypothetical protein